MNLETERLWLRPCTLSDIGVLHVLSHDPGVRRYLFDDKLAERVFIEDIVTRSLDQFEEYGLGLWVLGLHGDDTIIGFCGFVWEEGVPDINYAIDTPYWGRGLAVEAARAVLDCLFQMTDVAFATGTTDTPNTGSQRVLEKLGFSFVRRGDLNGLDTTFYRLDRP